MWRYPSLPPDICPRRITSVLVASCTRSGAQGASPGLVRGLGGAGYRGREGADRFYADTRENWEQLQTVAEEFRDLGDRVLVLGRVKGRGKASGAPVDQPFAGIFDFRGDRICRYRVYFDHAEGLRAAGLSD